MLVLDQIVNHILAGLLYVLMVFMLVDILIVYLVQVHKPLLTNKYFQFHKRYGLLRIGILKLICAAFLAYLLLEPSPNAGKLAVPIMVHAILVTKLLIDFVTKDG